jgi:uncharacterized membrane protein
MCASARPEMPASPSALSQRLESVDVVRGAAMVLMVLDHARDFVGSTRFSAVNLERTYPALFWTRWVPHLCAPAFVLLAGVGAYLATRRGRSKAQQTQYLLVRGLWLILLEVTFVRFGILFNLDYSYTPLGVLWAIGSSMIALAGLIWLPRPLVAAVAIALIAGHNLCDDVDAEAFGRLGWLWLILHEQGSFWPVEGMRVSVIYPLIPWVGVMAGGFALGHWLLADAVGRRRLIALGLGVTTAFFALRLTNVYGNPSGWSIQEDGVRTAMSFVNCKKYPPSLLFLLMTLGPILLALGCLQGRPIRWAGPLVVLGRTPLFFYLCQWPLVHALAIVVARAAGQPTGWMFASPPFEQPNGYGFGLPVVYGVWAATVLLLVPACVWFADQRQRRGGWLAYF